MSEKKVKILFVNNSSSLALGTTRSMLFNLKLLKEKYAIGVAAFPDSESLPSALLSQEISYHRLGFLPFASLRRLVRTIRQHEYDIIYANCFDKRSRDAFLAAKLTGKPFIWHVRDPVSPKWYKRFLKYADAVIANSKDTASEILEGSGYKDSIIILNGIDPEEFNRSRDELRSMILKSIGWPDNSFLILNIGALCSLKNQADAISITKRVVEKYPEARLVCLGAPVEEGYPEVLWNLIRKSGMSDHVRLLGSQLNVPDFLCAGDLLLHTDKRFPPFGRVIMESMAARLPVVAYCVRETPEIIDENKTAFLTKSGDIEEAALAVSKLIENPDLRQVMGACAYERVTRFFTARTTAEQVETVIQSVLQKKEKMRR
ncbi:glycosyltransferase family 4 protein [bacterium]|nr:glycosyltransferase family 4 protein [candidate division CSSED10-310 bacterium]